MSLVLWEPPAALRSQWSPPSEALPSLRVAREGTVAPPPPPYSEERGARPSQGPSVSVRASAALKTAHLNGLSRSHSPLSACGLRPRVCRVHACVHLSPRRAPSTCSRVLHFAFELVTVHIAALVPWPQDGITAGPGSSPISPVITGGQVGGRRFLLVLLVSASDIVVTLTKM